MRLVLSESHWNGAVQPHLVLAVPHAPTQHRAQAQHARGGVAVAGAHVRQFIGGQGHPVPHPALQPHRHAEVGADHGLDAFGAVHAARQPAREMQPRVVMHEVAAE